MRIKAKLEKEERKDNELTLVDYEIKNEALYILNKLYIPETIRTEVITAVYNTPITGHPRLAKTLYYFKKSYY